MPELRVTEEQLSRLDAVRSELESAYVDGYGHVRRRDAVEYLLDTYTSPGDADGTGGVEPTEGAEDPGDPPETSDDGTDGSDEEDDAPAADEGSGSDGGSQLQAMMNLLETHDDKWRKADGGDAPYEVDLPDGGTEPARTKDDVKRILFTNY